MVTDDDNYIGKLIKIAENENIGFLTYYKELQRRYGSPEKCQSDLNIEFINILQQKIRADANDDIDSKFGAYSVVNPTLVSPDFKGMFELDRICLSRYRAGSHYLQIESGRMKIPTIPREKRMCLCNTDIQTLRHCLLVCPLLQNLREKYNITSVENAATRTAIASFFNEMENILNI